MRTTRSPIQCLRPSQTSCLRAKASSGHWRKRRESSTSCCAIPVKTATTKHPRWISWGFDPRSLVFGLWNIDRRTNFKFQIQKPKTKNQRPKTKDQKPKTRQELMSHLLEVRNLQTH